KKANPHRDGLCAENCQSRDGFLVFVTSKAYKPVTGFNSIATADTRCNEAAAAAIGMNPLNLRGGVWKAWLSDGMSGPDTNFHPSTLPYATLLAGVTPTVTTVADNYTD